MTRRLLWIPLAAALTLTSFAQPWSGAAAEAGPGGKAVAASPCTGELSSVRQELAAAQAENARLQAELDKLQTAERKRVKRLEAQLGGGVIEKLQ